MGPDEQQPAPSEGDTTTLQDVDVLAYLTDIRTQGATWLPDYAERTRQIEQQIADQWGQAFASYDLLVIVVQRTLTRLSRTRRAGEKAENDAAYEALYVLAIRACQIAKEVKALLTKGYASAATTRWRALHEVHVVARLIEQHGSALATRYLRHDIVEKQKLANSVEEVFHQIGQPIPPEIAQAMAEVRTEYTQLKRKYANEPLFFKGDYGWASGFVNGQSFVDLERAAGLADHRFAYRIVSSSVHGNVAGAFADSITVTGGEALVLGPSPDGMTEPGQSAAYSLLGIETVFLRNVTRRDDLPADMKTGCTLTIRVLEALFEDVVEAFRAATEKPGQVEG